ncbi:MAG TPA: ligase-associated DNA damage response endonuclease PdeM [Burkholderiaceae bacterium]|nr:ligase-associated DNA damage response endonuclease PdeM [Burkholderiaceae bacterium]
MRARLPRSDRLDIELGGASWTLLAQRAAIWRERHWLVLADAHFGKAAAFRARGVPVPQGTTSENLARLDALVAATQPEALVFLGDLFHAREAHAPATLAAFREWRERHAALELVLVEGNHDLAAGPPPAALRIHCETEPWRVDTMAFCHQPQQVRGACTMAGHVHPTVRLHGRGADSVRLPCFWVRDSLTVLPAFGSFTGGASIARGPGERVIALAEDRLFEIPQLRGAA